MVIILPIERTGRIDRDRSHAEGQPFDGLALSALFAAVTAAALALIFAAASAVEHRLLPGLLQESSARDEYRDCQFEYEGWIR